MADDFWQGFTTSAIVGAANHAMKHGLSGGDPDPDNDKSYGKGPNGNEVLKSEKGSLYIIDDQGHLVKVVHNPHGESFSKMPKSKDFIKPEISRTKPSFWWKLKSRMAQDQSDVMARIIVDNIVGRFWAFQLPMLEQGPFLPYDHDSNKPPLLNINK